MIQQPTSVVVRERYPSLWGIPRLCDVVSPLSNVVEKGIRLSPSPRTRAAQRLEQERLPAANDAAAMNGPPDPEHALRELVGAGNPPAASVLAPVPAPVPPRGRPNEGLVRELQGTISSQVGIASPPSSLDAS
jgi:hypothetical protein